MIWSRLCILSLLTRIFALASVLVLTISFYPQFLFQVKCVVLSRIDSYIFCLNFLCLSPNRSLSLCPLTIFLCLFFFHFLMNEFISVNPNSISEFPYLYDKTFYPLLPCFPASFGFKMLVLYLPPIFIDHSRYKITPTNLPLVLYCLLYLFVILKGYRKPSMPIF